jgi:hypothetical protein
VTPASSDLPERPAFAAGIGAIVELTAASQCDSLAIAPVILCLGGPSLVLDDLGDSSDESESSSDSSLRFNAGDEAPIARGDGFKAVVTAAGDERPQPAIERGRSLVVRRVPRHAALNHVRLQI